MSSPRRNRVTMKAIRESIKQLAAQGYRRKQIAAELNINRSIVTRTLGPLKSVA